MTKSAWYVTFLAVAVTAGCTGCEDEPPGCVGICLDAAGEDGGMPPGDAGSDADREEIPTGCGVAGRMGGLCRRSACLDGLTCITEFMSGTAQLNIRNTFAINQATPEDPADPTTFVTVTTPVPADDIPITYANGSLCTRQCDTGAATDSCGTCAKCSGQIGGDILGIGPFVFIDPAMRTYGTNTGICRPHCTFDPEGRGMGCPEGYTCDGFTNLCLEACRNDAQCNGTLVITEDGEYGTWVVPDGGRTCNMTTGRCDWTGPTPEARVGDVCEGPTDCGTDLGFCLRGGTCAEVQCNRMDLAPDTTMDGVCDGGNGICLGTGGNMGALCIDGCNTADDCNPGNACIPLLDASGAPQTIGSFSGYCLGICDTVDSGTLTGEPDTLFGCRADEQCDMPDPDVDDGDPATEEDYDPDGTCRASCNPAATPSDCEADEICEAVSGTTYGFCRTLSTFCFQPGAEDCYDGQICNNVVGASTFGRCVAPCATAADCTVGTATTCVDDTGPEDLRGLCVETCTSPTTCGAGRTCRIPAGMTMGYCVEMP